MAVPQRLPALMVASIVLSLWIGNPLPVQGQTVEDAYWQALGPRLDVMAQALDRTAQLLGSGTVGTYEWATEVAAQVVAVRQMDQEIALIQPPSSLAQLHGIIVDGMGYCRRSLETIVLAIEHGSTQFLDYASAYMLACRNYMETAALMRNQIATVPVPIQAQPTASIATPAPPPTWTPVPGLVPSATPMPVFAPTATPVAAPPRPACDPSYPDVCIPPFPPDLDCADVPYRNFRVLSLDPHGFDRDQDGIGCEG